jgi:hypothetical protein
MSEQPKQPGNLVRKRKANNDSYETYIKNIKSVMYGDAVKIDKDTLSAIDDLISLTFYNLKKRAIELTNLINDHETNKTISDNCILHAARLELPDEISAPAFDLLGVVEMRVLHDLSHDEILPSPQFKDLEEQYGNEMYFINQEMYEAGLAAYQNAPKKPSHIKGGIMFPVGRVQRHLKYNHNYNCSLKAALAIASILEIVTIEILSKAVKKLKGEIHLTPRHLMLAIRADRSDVLLHMFHNVIIENSGEPEIRYEALSAF